MPCHGIAGAFQHDDVKIGWYPYRAIRTTEIRSLPGAGDVRKTLAPGEGIGVQSVRNPTGSSFPAQRQSVIRSGKQYVWCYSRSLSKTGWVPFFDIEYHPDANKPPLGGPAGIDFEVGRSRPVQKKPSGCGKVSKTKPVRRVAAEDTYLRYSPRGTAFHNLHRGDRVKLLIVDGPSGFAFCQVVQIGHGATVYRGTRGWILASSLDTIP
jgi:hypothetical protein